MIALLMLVVFVAKFFWLLVALAVTVLAARLIGGWLARRDDQAAVRRHAEAQICARADRQHAAFLAGDLLVGVHGIYPPEKWTWAQDALSAMREGVRP